MQHATRERFSELCYRAGVPAAETGRFGSNSSRTMKSRTATITTYGMWMRC